MPCRLERNVQMMFTIGEPDPTCRRAICRRFRYCMPPPDREHRGLFRCPRGDAEEWLKRAEILGKLLARRMKSVGAAYAASGKPSPFAKPSVPDHLDLSRPLDMAALLAQPDRS